LWFASRATGLVAVALLTGSLALGIVGAGRVASPRWPRFAVAALHRNISVLACTFLLVHIGTAIIDRYAGLRWRDAVVPFVSGYHPLWLGLGSVAFDLVIAVLLTTALRMRLSFRLWRMVHWTGYGCWPLALAHGLAIGGRDSRLAWVLAVNGACVALVVAAAVWRWRAGPHVPRPDRPMAVLGGR
jgi:predicted ferric reductase